ncbi:MAG: ATP-binding protein [Pseudomonadota bacterium]
MVFEPRFRLLFGVVALMGISAFATTSFDSPRILVLCALTVLPLAEISRRAAVALERRNQSPTPEVLLGIPAQHSALADKLLNLEARLEHAPVALFGIEQSNDRESVTPLNAYARRVMAPGRATDPAGLYVALCSGVIGRRSMITFDTERGQERALVSTNTVTMQGATLRLAALLPVESELETAALDAWQQLVKVLTHEIMNSLTPIASLSCTAHELLADIQANLPPGASDDLSTALDAIGRRADSLTDFIASYRTLTGFPAAAPRRIRLEALFDRLSALVTTAWNVAGGRTEFSVEPTSLELMIDAGQLEQALINLLQNAAEATANIDTPVVSVDARLTRGGRLRIEVCDNGPGVPDSLIPHIFTPFFSTKSRGSGIGLAMVRQLVHGNGGTVRYVKSAGAGARFVVTL